MYLDTDVIVKGDAEVSVGLVYRLTTCKVHAGVHGLQDLADPWSLLLELEL